jgi:AcrR family transcriptional regulator
MGENVLASPVRTPRQAWIDAGLLVLEQKDSDAVRVEALALQLGVTRGDFYRQFRTRDALLEAVLNSSRSQTAYSPRAGLRARCDRGSSVTSLRSVRRRALNGSWFVAALAWNMGAFDRNPVALVRRDASKDVLT